MLTGVCQWGGERLWGIATLLQRYLQTKPSKKTLSCPASWAASAHHGALSYGRRKAGYIQLHWRVRGWWCTIIMYIHIWAWFQLKKTTSQSQTPSHDHTYPTSRCIAKSHGLPLTCWSCHLLLLSQTAPHCSSWSVTCTASMFAKHQLKTALPELLNSNPTQQPLPKRHKDSSAPRPTCSQLLFQLIGANPAHLCRRQGSQAGQHRAAAAGEL